MSDQDHLSADTSLPVTVSIVSHGHGAMILPLLSDLAMYCGRDTEVILTLNIPETLPFDAASCPLPVRIVRNSAPKGFGANHNAAFELSRQPIFCVLNPDIRIAENPFPVLLKELSQKGVGVVAPGIVDPSGKLEDSARRFPTPWFLVRKLFRVVPTLDYAIANTSISPDWVAGMFMLFRAEIYRELNGFDEKYFLYYEDVDLCRRLRRRGFDVRLVPATSATHDARRQSHRNTRHLRWHLASLLRFLLTR